MSSFEEVLLRFPDKNWDWRVVSSNPSVSFEFILKHPNLPWVPAYVSCNPSVSEADIMTNLSYPWVLERLCANPNISFTFFNNFIYKPEEVRRIDWAAISANPGITMLDVINNPKYLWSDRYLSANTNLTSNFILHEGKHRKWFAPSVCANRGITERDIFKSTIRSIVEWDYRNLSANPNLPIAFVDANLHCDWNFHTISSNVSITDIHTFHKIPWDGYGLSINPNISFEYVMKHPALKWHAQTLLTNDAISIHMYQSNRAWFEQRLSTDNAIASLSANASITKEWIENNENSVDWRRLSSNKMNITTKSI